MRACLSILFLTITAHALAFGIIGTSSQPFNLLQNGLGGAATFGDGNEVLLGKTASDGTFNAQPVNAQDWLSGVTYTLDPSGFSVIGNTVYNKGSLNGGTYAALTTNLTAVFAGQAFSATNSRIIIGTVPSFRSGYLYGLADPNAGMSPPNYPTIQVSSDGVNWVSSSLTVPCLVSLHGTSAGSSATGMVINAYVNPAIVGQTNDLTGQTVLVTSSGAANSVASLSAAQSIATATVPLWANSPAVNNVNVGGHALVMSGDWNFNTASGTTLNFTGDGVNIVSLTPGILSGTKCVFQNLTKSGTNLIFQLSAPSTPAIQYETNLALSAWATLPSQSNWFAGGYYFVSAPVIATATNCFFRGSTAGTNSVAAIMTVHAQLKADAIIFTNAAGSRFSLTVNTSTNGFVFTPQP